MRAALFDLDGTLIDSLGLILATFRHTLQSFDKPFDEQRVLGSVGRSLEHTLGLWAADAGELDAMTVAYRRWNDEHHDELVRPFPGVDEALEALVSGGVTVGVVTSKIRRSAQRGLAFCGLERHVSVLVGCDDVELHKPDPAPVLHALATLAIPATDAVYVGDTLHDMQAGRSAGVRTAAVLWGVGSREELATAEPDLWFDDPHALRELAQSNGDLS